MQDTQVLPSAKSLKLMNMLRRQKMGFCRRQSSLPGSPACSGTSEGLFAPVGGQDLLVRPMVLFDFERADEMLMNSPRFESRIRFLRNLRNKSVLRTMHPTVRRRKALRVQSQGVSNEFEDMRKGAKFMKAGAGGGKQHGMVMQSKLLKTR